MGSLPMNRRSQRMERIVIELGAAEDLDEQDPVIGERLDRFDARADVQAFVLAGNDGGNVLDHFQL